MINKKYIIAVAATLAAILCFISVSMALLPRGEQPCHEAQEQENEETVEVGAASKPFRLLVAGRDRASGLFDVMMLVSFDRQERKACVLQIPRDTYFEYTDAAYKKINGAPTSLGGMRNFCSFLGESLGVKIDSYVSLDLDAFAKAVDAVGGVEIDLPSDISYTDSEQGLDISLSAGRQLLNGREAEQFVRFRSGYLRGDLGRLDAQKIFMAALFRKIKSSLSFLETVKLTMSILPYVSTDLSVTQLGGLISDARSLNVEDVSFVTAPGNDVVSRASGAWYYSLSAEGMKELLRSCFDSERRFDEKGLFLKENDSSFSKIYKGYTAPDIRYISDIAEGGIHIEQIN